MSFVSSGGLIPLHNACSFGHAEVVRLLLRHGADPNSRDNWNYTPLHEAAVKGKVDVCVGKSRWFDIKSVMSLNLELLLCFYNRYVCNVLVSSWWLLYIFMKWGNSHPQGCKLSWSSHNLDKISLYATKYLFYLQSYVNSPSVTPLKTNCCKKMRIYHTALKPARFIHIMLRKNFLNSQQWGKILEFLATTWGCRALQKNIYAILVFLSLGYTCKLEITPVTGVRVGVKIDIYPYLRSCAQKKIILY